jgi:predicted amidohydrolase
MRASLVVPETVVDVAVNKRRILDAISSALPSRPDLIVLPETVITGYQDKGHPGFDRSLCEDLEGEFLITVRSLARQHRVMISIGFFEKNGWQIHDASVLFSGTGEILQHYRRVDPHWRNPGVDSAIYRCGDEVRLASTGHGTVSTLICGDLFNATVREMTQALRPDYVIYPLAAIPEEGYTWESAVEDYYRAELIKLNAHVLMVNLLESGPGWPGGEGTRVGGAHVVTPVGELLHTLPTGRPGILTCDV